MKTSTVQYVTIPAEYAGQRIDNYLITLLKIPKSHIYRILRKGEVRVNKKRIAPNYRLQAGDEMRLPPLKLEESAAPLKAPDKLKKLLVSRILYEDDQLFILNKPSGIAVHAGSGMPWGIIEIFKSIYPHLPQLELVHRLDRDTSGCMIIAKKRSVLRELHTLLREGKVKKEYLALTLGTWTKKELKVDAPLNKNILSSGERIVRVDATGKESLTLFEVIEKYDNCTLVRAKLMTGRTHQIRVHARYRQHPIAGDEKYGDKAFNKWIREKGLKRLFLHAEHIRFALATGDKIDVHAPLDEELKECLGLLRPSSP